MGYYYRCRIPFLGDEDACIAFDALQIGLSSALAAADQGQLVSPRRDIWRCYQRATTAFGTGSKSSRINRYFCNKEMVAEEGFEPPTQGL